MQIINLGGHMAWHVATGDLDGNGTPAIVVGTYDGHVLRVDTGSQGTVTWDYPTGGPAPTRAALFDVAVGDFFGDGKKQIVAASADGSVYALGPSGNLLWKYDLQGGIALQARVAHLEGPAGPATVVVSTAARNLVLLSTSGVKLKSIDLDLYPRYVRVGHFVDASKDAVFVMATTGASGKFSLRLYGTSLTQLSKLGQGSYPPFAAADKQYGFDCTVAPVSGSGLDALITPLGTATYGANLSLGPVLGVTFDTTDAGATFPKENIGYVYRSEQVASGELTADPGLEIVSVNGPDLTLFAADGHVVDTVQVGNPTNVNLNTLPAGPVQPRGFTDAAFLAGNGTGRVVLGSSPNGDDNLYLVAFDGTWKEDLRTLSSPAASGVDAQVRANLTDLTTAIDAWSGAPATGQPGPFTFSVGGLQILPGTGALRASWAVADIAKYVQKYPPAVYPNLRFVSELIAPTSGAETSYAGGPWQKDSRYPYSLSETDIQAYAEYMESHGAKFWLWSGHGTAPYFSLATAENVLKTYAPTSCLGFIQAENEQLDTLGAYVENVLRPQLEVAKKYNKHVILREKGAFWAAVTAIPEVGGVLFNGNYAAVLVPSVEESNARTPDLNLAARVGAWLDGSVDHWSTHMAPDWFRFDVMDSTAYPLSGHAALRYFVTEAVLGSFSFSPLLGSGAPRVEEGLDPFLKLLGKGIIVPPGREQVKGVSPMVLRVRRTQTASPASRFVGSSSNGHLMSGYSLAEDGPATAWAFGQQGCFWGLAKTAPTDASTYLWGRKNQFDNHIPPTPYGLVTVLPTPAPRGGYPWSNITWETDGDQLYREGLGFGATADGQAAARTAMLSDLQSAAARFPFTLSGDEVFSQIVQQSSDSYLLYLVDPGFLTPTARQVTIAFNGTWVGSDRLAPGIPVTVSPTMSVTVPAGSLRIMELTRTATETEIDAGTDSSDAGSTQADGGEVAGGMAPASGVCGCSSWPGIVPCVAVLTGLLWSRRRRIG